jgi:flagellar FliL protein
MRMILIIVVAVVALALGVGGGWLAGTMLAPPVEKPVGKPTAPKVPDDKNPNADLFYDLPEVLVALHDSGQGALLLKFGISVESPSIEDLGQVKQFVPRVLDVFQTYIRTLDVKDLRGRRNLEKFREGLRQRIETATKPAKVTRVLFRDLTVQ